MLLTLLVVVYVICALLLAAYAFGSFTLLLVYLRVRRVQPPLPPIDRADLPAVGVQLPIYNEVYVAERLIRAVAALDYPRDRLFIQVLDDSTDETVEVVRRVVHALQAQGVQIEHIRRGSRAGYKAGALAHGVELLKARGVGFAAVLDADFIPPRDFLLRTVPYLVADPGLGMVQGRWGHLNADQSWLTRGQTLALDGHFVVEQTARNRAGWLMNFNGTGGVWRIAAIDQAGGWQDGTLTEDLDLSYRAQLVGWRFLYLPDVVVPGELPPQIAAYKQQQARWAKGGTQCMARLLGPIWRHPGLTIMQKVMASLHLGQYLVHPVIVVLLLITPPLLVLDGLRELPLGPLGIAGLGPPLVFIVSQRALYPDWRRRLLALPVLIALGTGLALNNARAVISGLLGQAEEFKRTPKFAGQSQVASVKNAYIIKLNSAFIWEFALSVYSLVGMLLALRFAPALAPYLGIYAFAFGGVALWGLRDYLDTRRMLAIRPA
ncbi:MAG: glycosyltransferase [Candidatus Flexifilum sp.]